MYLLKSTVDHGYHHSFPTRRSSDLNGGALWYDARMARPERLTLAFVASAAAAGALVANYAEAETFEVSGDRKSTRLNSSHLVISYAVFCLKKKYEHNVKVVP